MDCNLVSITIWLHYTDSNENLGYKARWKLHNDTACCFEQILEVAPNKTTAVWPLAFYLTAGEVEQTHK